MARQLMRRRNPERLAPLFRNLERLWDEDLLEPFGTMTEWLNLPLEERRWWPAMDVVEEGNAYKVKVDLPGLSKKDIELSVEDNRLTIHGERKVEKEVDEDRYHRLERATGKFHRMFTLPGTVDPERVEAKFKDGILLVTLPKTEEAKPKLIAIN